MEISLKILLDSCCKVQNYEVTEEIQNSNSNKILSLGGFDIQTAGILEIFNYEAKTWKKINTKINRRYFNVALIDNKLMIIGGTESSTDDDKPTNKVESLDLCTGDLTPVAPLNDHRNFTESVVVGKGKLSFLYVFGGWGLKDLVNTVERWDPVSKVWTFVTPMNIVRSGCGVAVLNNIIYVFGGRSGNNYQTSMEAYNMESDKWEMKASMRYTNGYFAATAHKNYIYMVGGNRKFGSRINTVERYDPKTDSWTSLANISSIGQVGIVSYNDEKLICVGGQSSSLVEEYDEKNDRWFSLPSSNVKREGAYLINIPKSMKYYEFIE